MGLALASWARMFGVKIGNMLSLMNGFSTHSHEATETLPWASAIAEAGAGEEEWLWRANQGCGTWHILTPSVHSSRRNGTNYNSHYKRLASCTAKKHGRSYGKTLHLIRCRLSFSLFRSFIMYLHITWSATHSPASPLSRDIINLSTTEGRTTNEDWTAFWLLCMLRLLLPFPYITQTVCMCAYAVMYYERHVSAIIASNISLQIYIVHEMFAMLYFKGLSLQQSHDRASAGTRNEDRKMLRK